MPNARVLPGDDDSLAIAHERMREATVEQLRTALVMRSEGAYLPTFAPFLAPFSALRAGLSCAVEDGE